MLVSLTRGKFEVSLFFYVTNTLETLLNRNEVKVTSLKASFEYLQLLIENKISPQNIKLPVERTKIFL